jgi:ribosomal protein S18 acetylase RimI-like enzyme
MVITEAMSEDVDALAVLFDAYRQFYRRSADLRGARSYVEERVVQGPTRFFVSREDTHIDGFVHLLPSFDTLAMKPMYILEDLYVEPKVRRSGVATALIRHAENFARANAASKLTLSTAHTNQQARRLYERQGWVLEKEFRYYHRLLD